MGYPPLPTHLSSLPLHIDFFLAVRGSALFVSGNGKLCRAFLSKFGVAESMLLKAALSRPRRELAQQHRHTACRVSPTWWQHGRKLVVTPTHLHLSHFKARFPLHKRCSHLVFITTNPNVVCYTRVWTRKHDQYPRYYQKTRKSNSDFQKTLLPPFLPSHPSLSTSPRRRDSRRSGSTHSGSSTTPS